jgi:hypothetical protein
MAGIATFKPDEKWRIAANWHGVRAPNNGMQIARLMLS